MRPIAKSWTPAALDADGYANDVATGAGTTLALTASVPGDGLAHEVTILNNSVIDHSGKTVTVVGTDADGRAKSVTITAPGASVAVTTTEVYFASVSSVTFNSTTGADTFDVGWNGVMVSQTIPLEWRSNATAGIQIDIGGTINYSIQQTHGPVFDLQPSTLLWVGIDSAVGGIADLTSITADASGAATIGAQAVRLLVNSVSAGATVKLYINQPSGYAL